MNFDSQLFSKQLLNCLGYPYQCVHVDDRTTELKLTSHVLVCHRGLFLALFCSTCMLLIYKKKIQQHFSRYNYTYFAHERPNDLSSFDTALNGDLEKFVFCLYLKNLALNRKKAKIVVFCIKQLSKQHRL